MTGISFMYSKPSSPMYSSCHQPNKIFNKLERVTTRNNVNLIPPKLSNHNLHTISPLLSTTHLFKHRSYSSSSANKPFATSNSSGFDESGNLPPVIVSVGAFIAKFIAFWPWMFRKLCEFLTEKNTCIKGWSPMESKFYVYTGDEDKILEICQEIFDMMKTDPTVYLYEEPPRCYPLHVYSDVSVLTMKCNVIYPTNTINPKQDIVDKAHTILEKHGVMPPPN